MDKEGPVTIIGINNPDRRNCVNPEIAQELTTVIEDFENDENALAGVLYGTGGNFCAGYDLKALSNFDQCDKAFVNIVNKHGTMVGHISSKILSKKNNFIGSDITFH